MESSKIFCEFYPQNAGIFVLKNLNFRIESQGHLFEIEMRNGNRKEVAMKLKNSGKITVTLNDIAAIVQSGKRSKNKTVYFGSRRPDTLCNFSTANDLSEKWHLKGDEFIETSRGHFVNRTHIRDTDNDGNILLDITDGDGNRGKVKIPVSRTRRNQVTKALRDNSDK